MTKTLAPPPATAPISDYWNGCAHPSVRPQPPILERQPVNWNYLVAEARPLVAHLAVSKLVQSPDATAVRDLDRLVMELWNEMRGELVDARRGITLDMCLSTIELGSPVEFLRGVCRQLFLLRDSLPQLKRQHAALGALVTRFEALGRSS